MPEPISLYIDADACPVKHEVYRVAERHLERGVALKVFVVANSFINTPRVDFIESVIVPGGMDVADDWIAERAKRGDVVITADVPLAARAVKAGADHDRAERQAVHEGQHRRDTRDAQPDDGLAFRRRNYIGTAAVHPA